MPASLTMDPERIVLITHIGMGDGIIQSGLAVALLDRFKEVAFPCYTHYLPTFRSIFANYSAITVFGINHLLNESWGSPKEKTFSDAIQKTGWISHWRQLRLGVYSGRGIELNFVKSFYDHANIPYASMWRFCPIPNAWQRVQQIEPQLTNGSRRIFVHDDKTRNFVISPNRIPKPTPLSDIFRPPKDYSLSALSYAGCLIASDEVHCIDSGFMWLADSLPVQGRLFLHRYARWPRPKDFRYETRHFWNEID